MRRKLKCMTAWGALAVLLVFSITGGIAEETLCAGQCACTLKDGEACVAPMGEDCFQSIRSGYPVLRVTAGSNGEHYAQENGLPYMRAGEHILRGVMPGSDAVLFARENEIPYLLAGYNLDASGQFEYMLRDGSAVLSSCWEEPVGDLVIPGALDGYPLTSIEGETFVSCTALTGVTIPEGVTEIGDFAFFACSGMRFVILPDSMTSIREYAFADCTSLTAVNIPAGVTKIEGTSFLGCPLTKIDVSPDNPALAQIDGVLFDKQAKTVIIYPQARVGAYAVPEGVTHIGDAAFWQCAGLTGVNLPHSVTRIGYDAFSQCSLTDVILPNSVIHIGAGAFSDCEDLASVTIPSSVQTIDDYAFSNCGSLRSVAFSSGATTIGERAFFSCKSLASVAIPASVTEIGEDAFSGCAQLTLRVTKGSYAEQYAIENALPYALIASGGSGEDNVTLTGKYGFVSMQAPDEKVDAAALAEQGMDSTVLYLEFIGNKVMMYAFGETILVTYKADGNHIEIDTDEGPLQGTLDGDTMTLDLGDGVVLVVEKE